MAEEKASGTRRTASSGGVVGASDPGEHDESKRSSVTEPGGNPGKDDERAAGGKEPSAQGLAQSAAAEIAVAIKTTPAEVEFGDSEVVDADDADKLEGLLTAHEGETFVRLEKEVLETFYYPDTKRPSHRVLFHKGQVVARSVIEERAAAIRAAKATGVAAQIDATTLASGTYPGIEAAGVAD
jgi:hypothetical protein